MSLADSQAFAVNQAYEERCDICDEAKCVCEELQQKAQTLKAAQRDVEIDAEAEDFADEIIDRRHAPLDGDSDTDDIAKVRAMFKAGVINGEIGLLDLFDSVYGDKFAYVVVRTKGEWMLWNGKFWQSTNLAIIRDHAVKLARLIEKAMVGKTDGKDEKAFVAEVVKKFRTIDTVQKVMKWLEGRRLLMRSEFDNKPNLFNFNNGTYDLDAQKFREFCREDYLTQISSVSYKPTATCPTWDKFLVNAFPTSEMREYVQRYFGYCLSGTATEKAALIFHGNSDSGKTTMLEVLLAIFGYHSDAAYGKSCSWATFAVQKSGQLTIRDDLARLHNARLVVCDESDKRMEIAQALFEALTGGSLITARGLFRDLFTYVANFKVVLATNHRPKIVGDDEATWNRVQDVPMTQNFGKGHPDRIDNLKSKLMSEREGIALWMVEGWKNFKKLGGLYPPTEVVEATAEYRLHSDVQAEFFKDRTKPGLRVALLALFECHKAWSKQVGEPEMSRAEFVEFLRDTGHKVKRELSDHGQPYFVYGIVLGQQGATATEENFDDNLDETTVF